MIGGYFKRNSLGFGSSGGGIFTKPETGEDGVGLADTGGEPSTQAGGCSFSTNEKKFHGTFDEEFIEGTAKLGNPRRVQRGGCGKLVLVGKRTPYERVFSEWMACLRVDSRCVLISITTRLRSRYLCLASRPRKLPGFGPNLSPSANDPMLLSRSSASRSAARRPPATSGNVHSLLSPKQAYFWACKHRIPPWTR
jgi:hypothetical protein